MGRKRSTADTPSNDQKNLATYWREKITAGLKYREKQGDSKKWKDYRSYYRGEWDPTIVPVNMIYSYGRALIPRVYFNSPRVIVSATHPDFVEAAIVVEAVDNWLIQETMLKQTIKSACLDAYLCGTGPIKIGYDSEFGHFSDLAVGPNTETATQEGTRERRRIEYKTYVKPGMPWAIRSDPDDVIVPFGYKYANDMPWIAHRILRPLEDIKNDQKYSHTAGLKGTRYFELTSDGPKHTYNKGDEIVYGELFEIRDFRTGFIIVLCEDQVILSDVDELQMSPHGIMQPWEFIQFNEDPTHFWAIPDCRQILAQQLEINMSRTQAQRHRAISLLKFIIAKGSFSPEDQMRLLSGDVGPLVECSAESIASAVQLLQPHVPPDLDMAANVAKSDIREILGFDYNQAGMMKPGTPPTATETNTVSESFGMRADERKDIVADVLVNIISKYNNMVFRFWDEDRVIQVVGQDGVATWVEFKGAQLQGDYRLRIDPESGFPPSHQARMQIADKILGQFGGDQMVNQEKLKQIALEQAEFALPGISRILNNTMEGPMAQGLSAARQPMVQGTGRNTELGNRGGGNEGSSPEAPVSFEKFLKSRGGNE